VHQRADAFLMHSKAVVAYGYQAPAFQCEMGLSMSARLEVLGEWRSSSWDGDRGKAWCINSAMQPMRFLAIVAYGLRAIGLQTRESNPEALASVSAYVATSRSFFGAIGATPNWRAAQGHNVGLKRSAFVDAGQSASKGWRASAW
jgi:hypothetical protein